MDSEYAGGYRELYERHWWWRARETYIASQLERLLPRGAAVDILDVGCGDGLMFDVLGQFGRVEGVEVDAKSVSSGGPWADRIFVRPFDETFDAGRRYRLIAMFDALEHMPDPAQALRRALELFDTRGIVVVTVPAFNQLWTSHDVLNAHYARFTRSSLKALAARTEARVVYSRYFFHWLVPVKLAVRVKEAVFAPHGSNPRIPPGWINRSLIHVSRIEQRSISRHSIPFGGSLFAVLAPTSRNRTGLAQSAVP